MLRKTPALLSLSVVCGLFFGLARNGQAEIWHGCALAPNGNDAWVVTIETTAVLHTTDAGAHWAEQVILTNHDFFDVFFIDELNGWTCGTIAEVQHTTDGGNTWNWQGFGTSKFFTRIFFIDPTHGWAAAGAAIMGRWDEAGSTWQQIILPYPAFNADTCDFYGVSFVDTLNGWICAGRYPQGDTFSGGQGYIGRTADGGLNWSLLQRDTINDLFDIEFRDTLQGWVVGGDDRTMHGYIARTTDGGSTWIEQYSGDAGLLRAVDFVDSRRGCAVGKFGTILVTTDGGNTWMQRSSGVDSTLFDVDFADTLAGIASGADAILFTSDGGMTWRRSPAGIWESPQTGDTIPNRGDSGHVPSRVAGPELQVPSFAQWPVTLTGAVPAASDVSLAIFTAQGKLVRTLLAGRSDRGHDPESRRFGSCPQRFRVVWDGRDGLGMQVSSGVYIARLATDAGVARRRMLYLRE
jgi:photosystem II stability/assembly factor-like uncharacterized protein